MSDFGSGLNKKRETLDAFGERLKARRDFLGLTQDFLAQKTGISRAAIQSYEAGKIPKGDYLLVLSELLECSVDWLLKGTLPQTTAPDCAQPAPQAQQPPAEDFKMTDMVTKTIEVLESDTIYRTALASNINAFHQAVNSERTLARLEERMAVLETRMEDLANENNQLKKQVEQQAKNLGGYNVSEDNAQTYNKVAEDPDSYNGTKKTG